ncbi:MAG: hypothetical protein AB7I18_12290 [Candidatus Berkiella sp.]
MNDDNKENRPEDQLDDFEEEFEFEAEPSEEDALAPEEFEAEGPEDEPVVKPRKSMMLPIVIAVAAVGFIGWKLFDMFGKEEAPPPPPKVEKTEAPAPVAPPVAPVEKIAPQSSIASLAEAQNVIPQEVTATEASLTKLQKKLEEQDNALKARITALEGQLTAANQNAAQTNAGIDKLQNDLASLNTAVQELGSQIRVFQEEREKQLQKAAAKKQPPRKVIESANPNLSVYAIIPGRAWLRSSNGKTITVTEGDSVGEYGKVLKIDAGNGVVVTSSGVSLR